MNKKHMAKKALERRMAAIGKTMDEIMPQEVEELVELAVKDLDQYPLCYKSYDGWMEDTVSSGGPGVLRLNI